MRYFREDELKLISHSERIAHELVHEHFKLSNSYWQKHVYEIITLKGLAPKEIVNHALAQILKYKKPLHAKNFANQLDTFFRICIQDHVILQVIEQNNELDLKTLLLYTITHELVHLVRFGNFMELFEAPYSKREKEERVVHDTTLHIIKRVDNNMGKRLEKCHLSMY